MANNCDPDDDPPLPELYVQCLKAHDWEYEFSDDHRKWKRGLEQRQLLDKAQKLLDPDFIIWNQYAPSGHKRHHWVGSNYGELKNE